MGVRDDEGGSTAVTYSYNPPSVEGFALFCAWLNKQGTSFWQENASKTLYVLVHANPGEAEILFRSDNFVDVVRYAQENPGGIIYPMPTKGQVPAPRSE